jgi:hypothetical protein
MALVPVQGALSQVKIVIIKTVAITIAQVVRLGIISVSLDCAIILPQINTLIIMILLLIIVLLTQ